MNRLSVILIVLVIISFFTANTNAREANTRSERALGFGVATGFSSMSVGDNSNANFGLSLNARLGFDSRNHFLLMAEIYPLRVKSPVMDESFNAFNIILSPSFGKTFRLRPGLGLQLRTWSGSEKVTDKDKGLLIGIDAGYEFQRSDKFAFLIEFIYRTSVIELEGSVASQFIGLQIVVLRRI